MLRRTLGGLVVAAAIAVSSAGTAAAAGFDTNHGKPTDNGNCIGFFSNGGAQADFIQDVRGGGAGAVGQVASDFGNSGGNGEAATSGCA